jgi:hypothetical protein
MTGFLISQIVIWKLLRAAQAHWYEQRSLADVPSSST